MIFIFGGAYQGKYDFAKEKFGIGEEDTEICSPDKTISFDKKVIRGIHAFVYGCIKRGEDAEAFFKANEEKMRNCIIISDDISRGIVPLDKDERAWREMCGRCNNLLVSQADAVYQVYCGLGEKVPKTLPSSSKWILIRHGITEGNLKNWYYGAMDIPLAEEGRKELEKRVSEGFYPELPEDVKIFTSGMRRADETLKIIYGERSHEVIDDLKEMNFGIFEGKAFEELKDDPVFMEWGYDTVGRIKTPNGESRLDFAQRIRRGRDKIIDGYLKDPGTTVLLVSHGGPIALIMYELFSRKGENLWEWMPEPGCGFIVHLEDGDPLTYTPIDGREKGDTGKDVR
jgi:alpha-ribazole phosphatase